MSLSRINLRYFFLVLGLAVTYFLAAQIGLPFAFPGENITPVWPPAGVALAALLLFGAKLWPGVAIGQIAVVAFEGEPLLSSIGVVVGNTVQPIVAVYLLERLIGFRAQLDRLKDLFGLAALAAAASSVVSATIGVTAIIGFGPIPVAEYGSIWLVYWLGDVLGILIVAPVLLTWSYVRPRSWRLAQVAEAGALLTGLLLVGEVAFSGWLGPGSRSDALEFAVFPLLIWAALRFGSTGASGAILLLSGFAISGTVSGFGPFAGGDPQTNLMLLQAFIAVVAITALALAAITSERRSALDDLEASRQRLRHLSLRLQSIREEERKRIAREIHDQLGQVLTVLKVDLSLLGQRRAQGRELRQRLESMSELVDAGIETVRRISTELRPRVLDDLGLAAAIEWQAEEFEKRTGIRCEVEIKPRRIAIDPERSTACFRILQEALTNVARHANASKLTIRLHWIDGHVRLQVKDNGCGISREKLSDPKASGLVGMRERVLPWNGDVLIHAVPDQGTEVTVVIPLDPSPAPRA